MKDNFTIKISIIVTAFLALLLLLAFIEGRQVKQHAHEERMKELQIIQTCAGK